MAYGLPFEATPADSLERVRREVEPRDRKVACVLLLERRVVVLRVRVPASRVVPLLEQGAQQL